jgi:hypothetical protein
MDHCGALKHIVICKLDEWCKLTGLDTHICIFLGIHRPDALKYKESEVHSAAYMKAQMGSKGLVLFL